MDVALQLGEDIAADVCEIIEALAIPVVANDVDKLLKITDRAKLAFQQTSNLELLVKAEKIFEHRRGKGFEDFIFRRDRAAEYVISELRKIFPLWPYFVFHGTSTKYLSSILENGLVVGWGSKSRWKNIVDDQHLNSGIFLTDNWRGAVSWAQSTALTRESKLRKDGSRPVIIRVKARDLELFPDVRARAPGCLVSRNNIEVAATSGFVIDTPGTPSELAAWSPLQALVAEQPPASRM